MNRARQSRYDAKLRKKQELAKQIAREKGQAIQRLREQKRIKRENDLKDQHYAELRARFNEDQRSDERNSHRFGENWFKAASIFLKHPTVIVDLEDIVDKPESGYDPSGYEGTTINHDANEFKGD